MDKPQGDSPIIIIKKNKAHHGHHGGAWKVAYADFVTAMMALFIVLWLLSSSEKVRKAVGGYFQDPSGSGKMAGSTMAGAGESVTLQKDDMPRLKEKIEQALKEVPKLDQLKEQIKLIVTGEGLRVELLESEQGTFFESGSPKPTATGSNLLIVLAQQLGRLPNKVTVEGHTDAKPYPGDLSYSNWELSADRANAARRLMQANGLREDQVAQVRGFAAQRLLRSGQPLHPSNRRVSVIVQYLKTPDIPVHAASEQPSAQPVAQNQPRH
jgi:chemotaxis protein MotB